LQIKDYSEKLQNDTVLPNLNGLDSQKTKDVYMTMVQILTLVDLNKVI
jgi:hypothetical protein